MRPAGALVHARGPLKTLPRFRWLTAPLGALVFVLSVAAAATPPVQLGVYPQKVRTFFAPEDPAVPAALRTDDIPLPVGQIAATARATDGAVWLGTAQGLVRLDDGAAPADRRQYFGGKRYLPDDDVRRLVPAEAGGMWVRTRTGVAKIELRPMTLAQKAAHFEAIVAARHDRYGLTADSHLGAPGDTAQNIPVDNDNDGLWTAIYAAAECFRFAVTGAPEAQARARKAIEAMLFLEEVAGGRGFPARSFIRKGDRLPRDGEWHWTPDGQYYWKADTSSDEIVGHYVAFGIAYDLLPDADLKAKIVATTRRITDHIIANGYTLVDLDGKPTKWGWWSKARFAEDPEETALNSLQLLSFLLTAAHITGDERYAAEYRKVAHELGYLDLILKLKQVRTELNFSDEELAMLPFYGVFRYERDPARLAVYRRALDDWWENMAREKNPLWTLIYLVAKPDADVDLPGAVRTLARMPLDVIHWDVKNSHRADIVWAEKPDRFGKREAVTLLPPDERPTMRWNANPFVVDGGRGGRAEDDGAAYLLPYWLGRYHKRLLGE